MAAAPLGDGEKGIDDPLSGDQRGVGVQPFSHWAGRADRPLLAERQRMDYPFIVSQSYHCVADRIFSVRFHLVHYPGKGGRDHAAVLDDRRLLAGGVYRTRLQAVARLDGDAYIPLPFFIQGGDVDAAADKVARLLLDRLERPFDPVEYIVQDPGAQGGAKRPARADHRFPRAEPGGVLIYLDGGFLVVDADDLADQLVVSDQHHLHHRKAGVPEQGNDRAVDSVNPVFFCAGLARRTVRMHSFHSVPV